MSLEKIAATVIGGGVVGLACALKLTEKFGSGNVALLEKNSKFGTEQSGRSSEVIHSGINNEGLKLDLCVKGNRQLYDFCEKFDVPYSKCGKLIVATNKLEVQTLDSLFLSAKESGVNGVLRINSKGILRLEPNVVGLSALRCKTTGILDSASYVKKLVGLNQDQGSILLTESCVTGLAPFGGDFLVQVGGGIDSYHFKTELLINCAGLYSDKIAKMLNANNTYEIVPVKGEYMLLKNSNKQKINGNIYPVPWSFSHDGREYNDLGIHLTPTTDGSLIKVGPAVIPVTRKDDYCSTLGREVFSRSIKNFYPQIRTEDLQPGYCGILAEQKESYDFTIEHDKLYHGCVHLIGIESPGLTASLAIADHVSKMI